MIDENLNYKYYFSNNKFFMLFNYVNYVWDAIPLIKEFINFRDKAGKTVIGNNTIIEPGASISKSVIIGDNCVIRSGAYIRENVIIGDNCVIRTEIKNSVVMDHTNIAHPGYVGDSIIGSYCNFGINVALTNLKLYKGRIKIKMNENTYETGLRKLGSIVGDNSNIGSNVVLSPGTLVGKNVIVYPLTFLRGYIPNNSIVKNRPILNTSPYIKVIQG